MHWPLVLLAIGWCLYFAMHSLLATDRAKSVVGQWLPGSAKRYRLFYNAISTLALIPLLIVLRQHGGDTLWEWRGMSAWIANGIAGIAAAGFFWTTRYYDISAFLGLRQDPGQPVFSLSPIHRVVRHPWYFFLLLIIWTRDFDTAWMVSAAAITLYLIIGSRLEDRKLVIQFGDAYAGYMRRVPGLFPIPGKYLRNSDLPLVTRDPP